MKFINRSQRTVSTALSGTLAPGQSSSDGGPQRRKLAEILEEIVKLCGDGKRIAIKLNDRELYLVDRLITLDQLGSGFDPKSIPDAIRNDPTGYKKMLADVRKGQNKEIEENIQKNKAGARREAIINGEVSETGPRAEGEKVDPQNLKSGFERILEENAKIAAGQDKKPPMDAAVNLDPIGAFAKKDGAAAPEAADPDQADAAGDAKNPVEQAKGREDDGTRTADAKTPEFTVADRAGAMDAAAKDIAEQLSTVGPAKQKGRGKGKGKTK